MKLNEKQFYIQRLDENRTCPHVYGTAEFPVRQSGLHNQSTTSQASHL